MKRNLVLGVFFIWIRYFYILLLVIGWRLVHIILRLALTIRRLKHYKRKKSNVGKKEATEYNKQVQISAKTFTDPFSEKSNHQAYADVLNLGDVMGYIEISKINIKLPIYQGPLRKYCGRDRSFRFFFAPGRWRKYAYYFNRASWFTISKIIYRFR